MWVDRLLQNQMDDWIMEEQAIESWAKPKAWAFCTHCPWIDFGVWGCPCKLRLNVTWLCLSGPAHMYAAHAILYTASCFLKGLSAVTPALTLNCDNPWIREVERGEMQTCSRSLGFPQLCYWLMRGICIVKWETLACALGADVLLLGQAQRNWECFRVLSWQQGLN